MHAYQVSRLIIVPSLLTVILASSARVERLTTTTLWIASGEALPLETVRAFRSRLPVARLVNLYGASEAACDDTWGDVVDDERTPGIGGPVSGASIQLLDERMVPVAAGALGEIHVGGEVVNRGYFGDPRQTAASFVPDPCALGARIFRTRDIGGLQSAGRFAYHGRADQQIILRGIRIETAEVEAALAACRGVATAAVAYDETARALVAYVVPDERELLLRGGGFRVLPSGLALFEYRRTETDYLVVEADEGHTPVPVLADGAVVIDVGANIGMFSLASHYAARDVHIVAIEPAPAVSSVLRRNLVLHECSFDLLVCAVGARSGERLFTFYAEASLESGLHANASKDERIFRAAVDLAVRPVDLDRLAASRFESETFPVNVITLSDVIRRYGLQRIDLVKIDVERAELEVLEGLEREDFDRIDRFIVEVEEVGGVRAAMEKLFPADFTLAWRPHGRLGGVGLWMLDAVRRGLPPKQPLPARALEGVVPDSSVSERALRAQLVNVLPAYMLPARIHVLDELPRTPSGKLDRRALSSMLLPQESMPARPMDAYEKTIREAWRAALRRDDIGLDDNFFDVGGHSLLVLEVLDRLAKAGETNLVVTDLYMYPTIAALAGFLRLGEPDRSSVNRGASRGKRRRLHSGVRDEESHDRQ